MAPTNSSSLEQRHGQQRSAVPPSSAARRTTRVALEVGLVVLMSAMCFDLSGPTDDAADGPAGTAVLSRSHLAVSRLSLAMLRRVAEAIAFAAGTARCRAWPRRCAWRSPAWHRTPAASSPGELEMTLSTSEVAVCCSSDSVRSSVRWRSSLSSRVFSMAITAWAAKVVTSVDLLVGERLAPPVRQTRIAPTGSPSRSIGTTEHGPDRPTSARAAAAAPDRHPRRCDDRRRAPAFLFAGCVASHRSAVGRIGIALPAIPSKPADVVELRRQSMIITVDSANIPRTAPRRCRRRVRQRWHRTPACSIARRAAEMTLQHLGGRGLLLQRLGQIVGALAQLVEQPRVLDGDHGLGGEVLHQLDLLVVERPHLLAIDGDRADNLLVAEHRHDQQRSAHRQDQRERRLGSRSR